MAKLAKKKSAQKKSKTKAKSNSKSFEKLFGGLKKHNLKIKSINVFALKIEYMEEGAPVSPPPPAG